MIQGSDTRRVIFKFHNHLRHLNWYDVGGEIALSWGQVVRFGRGARPARPCTGVMTRRWFPGGTGLSKGRGSKFVVEGRAGSRQPCGLGVNILCTATRPDRVL